MVIESIDMEVNEQTTQPTEQNGLERFLTHLAAVAEAGGDVIATIQRGEVAPPDNVPHIAHGSTGEKVWERQP